MAIKRGVSFYSYQQEQFLKRMDYRDMARELRENLDCDGVEIINETTVPGYPFPSPEFIADWHNTMARYELNPVGFDGALDTLRFRDHVMTEREAAELIKLDLKIAHDMGFKYLRTMTGLPNNVIEYALDTAVKYDVKIAWEIHAPIPIRPDKTITGLYSANPGTAVYDTTQFIKETGTDHVGFVVDMGIFARGPFLDTVERMIRDVEDEKLRSELEELLKNHPLSELKNIVSEEFKGKLTPQQIRVFDWKVHAAPEDIELILPYVVAIHGKCHDMVEIEGQPGCYEEPALMYEEVIEVLKKNDWDGYIFTEFEGQRSRQERGLEHIADEVEQVRRHHEMLVRLIEGTS